MQHFALRFCSIIQIFILSWTSNLLHAFPALNCRNREIVKKGRVMLLGIMLQYNNEFILGISDV